MSTGVISIPPYQYIHVLDTNSNVTRVVSGPQRYTRQDHERLVEEPRDMINVPPRCYVVVRNPHVREENGDVAVDRFGQVRLRHGDVEIRMVDHWPEPFPLMPGEQMVGSVMQLQVVEKNAALRLRATRTFEDDEGVTRDAGDEWIFLGPGTYIPRVEVELVDRVNAIVITHNQAMRLRARRATRDASGVERQAGEEWLVRTPGAYLPLVDEEVVGMVNANVLTEKTALHMSAIKSFTDAYGHERKAGEHWLVTSDLTDNHIQDVYEAVEGTVRVTTLNNRQYCVVLDPYVNGVQHLGTQELRKGECSFFLKPGETLAGGIQDVYVLSEEEALLLQAVEAHTDADGETRQPGDKWMVFGPCDYIPPTAVSVLDSRRSIPLDDNEGIYVRDNKTGQVRSVIGQTYMLSATEELWAKELPHEVEVLLERQALGQAFIVPEHYGGAAHDGEHSGARNPTNVVKFRVPHNSALQVYDYKKKTSRVVFGPDLVMLDPDEQFSVMRLSGDKPKRPNVITSLCLMMGPDFMTDVITVETSDHARLQLTLSYNWHFEIDEEEPARMFNVRDFTGDACKAMASRVRGAVASETFDNFHKHSARIIRGSVFGLTEDGRVGGDLRFEANGLVITNVDIQSVEPVDQSTRQSLQKSVQMAIEITTNSQEARAKHDALCEEESAKGRLERQRLENEASAEAARRSLLELRAESAAVETSGQAKAEARARSEAAEIEGEGAVKQARLRAEAMTIEAEAALATEEAQRRAELEFQNRMNELEVSKARQMAEIEATQFAATVNAIGAETIVAIARAGPELQAQLLQGLGLQGFMVTDGKSPINLFQTAQGMIQQPGMGGAAAGAGASDL